jgi:hypothetical protein
LHTIGYHLMMNEDDEREGDQRKLALLNSPAQ